MKTRGLRIKHIGFAEGSIGVQGFFAGKHTSGIGQYTHGILREWVKGKRKFLLVVPQACTIDGIPNSHVKVLPMKKYLPHRSVKKWFWERIQVPRFFASLDLGAEFYPYPCPLPKKSKHKRIMTVHDTFAWTDPRCYGGYLKEFYIRASRRSVLRVDMVTTVSETVKKELNLKNVKIAGNAVPEYKNIKIKSKKPKSLKQRLVYLGGYDLRKRVPALVEAFEYLNQKYPNMRLSLIGEAHHVSKYYPHVKTGPGIERLGVLSDDEVRAALSESFAFVHFSDSEGFNIPLLQAMEAGTPAIVMDIPVNREISENTALFMTGSHSLDLFDKVEELMIESRRIEIINAQKKIAKNFSWEKSANKLWQLFEDLNSKNQ